MDKHVMEKRNAEVVLQYTTVYPFRLRGKDLLCVYCCDQFEDPDVFRQHMNENHEKFTVSTAFYHMGRGSDYLKVDCTDLKCRICLESFEVLQDAAKHISMAHEKVSEVLNLNYNIGMQPYRLNKDNWQCYICNKRFPSLVKLGRHMPTHYLQYTCDICGRCYLKNETLKYHIRCSHSGNYLCRKCWVDFPTAEARREHVRTSKKCWTFACIYCGDRFQSWETKQNHLMEHHGCKKPSYPCVECDMTFQSRKRFYAHHKTTHTDENFVCSCCGLKFGTKKLLEDHRLGHTGEKKFMCAVCSKAFTRKKSLIQHLWIHSETKRFECVICSKQFAQKVSYTGHMKSHHPEASL